jgi:hypothetical protein
VSFARGNACADKIVSDFIADDKKPDQRDSTCPGVFVSP